MEGVACFLRNKNCFLFRQTSRNLCIPWKKGYNKFARFVNLVNSKRWHKFYFISTACQYNLPLSLSFTMSVALERSHLPWVEPKGREVETKDRSRDTQWRSGEKSFAPTNEVSTTERVIRIINRFSGLRLLPNPAYIFWFYYSWFSEHHFKLNGV